MIHWTMTAMNDNSLSQLYRRLTAARGQQEMDVEALACVLGDRDSMTPERRATIAAELSSSPRNADLVRMLSALEPDSQALADAVNAVRRQSHPSHARQARGVRVAAGTRRHTMRRVRWATGLAAGLAVAIGLLSWHSGTTDRWNDVAAAARTAPVPDRIFTTRDRIFASSDDKTPRGGAPARGDTLFRGSFAVGG